MKSIILPDGLETICSGAFRDCEKLESIVIPESVTSIDETALTDTTSLQVVYYPDGLEFPTDKMQDTTVVIRYIIDKDTNTVSFIVDQVPEGKDNIILPECFNDMPISSICGGDGIEISGFDILKENAPGMPEEIMKVPFIIAKVGDVVLDERWEWQDSDVTLDVEEVVTATAVYIGEDKKTYKNNMVSVHITRLACKHDGEMEIKDKKDATCKEDGYTGDTYCKICEEKMQDGETISKSTTHTWDEGKVTKEPTGTETGEKIYTCIVCQITRAEEIPATGQSENKGDGNTENTNVPKKGVTVEDAKSKAQYIVTKSEKDVVTVEYVKSTNKNAKKITIPATISVDGVICKVTSIRAKAFKNNKKLTKIIIGSNIKTIGADAFYGCKRLKTVTMGNNVTTIGNRAFYKCTSLTKITIPAKVKKIGKQAFYGCKKLKRITIKTTKLTKKNIGTKAFKGTSEKAKVKVPKKKFVSYKKLLKAKGISTKAKITK